MSLELAFLQDVCEHPNDDVPRLIFADWLDENGQAGRAEFIRLQVEFARLEGDPARDARRRAKEVRHRERQVFALHRKELLGPLLGQVDSHVFRRGFLERLRLSASQLLASGEALADHPACNNVQLWWVDVPLADLLKCPHLAWVTDLSLNSHQADERWSEELIRCPYLVRLRTLEVSIFRTLAEAEAVASATNFPELRELTLSGAYLGNGLAEALARATGVAKLERLSLRHNSISDEGAAALAASPSLGRLRALDLRENELTPRGAELLRQRFGEAVKIEPQYDPIPF